MAEKKRVLKISIIGTNHCIVLISLLIAILSGKIEASHQISGTNENILTNYSTQQGEIGLPVERNGESIEKEFIAKETKYYDKLSKVDLEKRTALEIIDMKNSSNLSESFNRDSQINNPEDNSLQSFNENVIKEIDVEIDRYTLSDIESEVSSTRRLKKGMNTYQLQNSAAADGKKRKSKNGVVQIALHSGEAKKRRGQPDYNQYYYPKDPQIANYYDDYYGPYSYDDYNYYPQHRKQRDHYFKVRRHYDYIPEPRYPDRVHVRYPDRHGHIHHKVDNTIYDDDFFKDDFFNDNPYDDFFEPHYPPMKRHDGYFYDDMYDDFYYDPHYGYNSKKGKKDKGGKKDHHAPRGKRSGGKRTIRHGKRGEKHDRGKKSKKGGKRSKPRRKPWRKPTAPKPTPNLTPSISMKPSTARSSVPKTSSAKPSIQRGGSGDESEPPSFAPIITDINVTDTI